jgi:hypothetical protein
MPVGLVYDFAGWDFLHIRIVKLFLNFVSHNDIIFCKNC